MSFPLTSLFAVAFGILLLILWLGVTKHRARAGISIGEGDDVALHEKIRRHGNFIEWVPMTLLLMALAEAGGAAASWLWVAGGLALLGRVLHPFGLSAANPAHPGRIIGNIGNIVALLLLIGLLVAQALV